MTTALPWLASTLIEPRDPLWLAGALGILCAVMIAMHVWLIWARSRDLPKDHYWED